MSDPTMKNADRCIREFILITLIFLPTCSNPASAASPTPSPSVPGGTLSMEDEETVIDRFLSTDIGMVEFIAVKEDVDIPLVGQIYLTDSELQEKLTDANNALRDMYEGIKDILAEGQLTELTYSNARDDALAYYFLLHDEDNSILYVYSDGTLKTVFSGERRYWRCERGMDIVSLCEQGAQAFKDFADAMNSSHT